MFVAALAVFTYLVGVSVTRAVVRYRELGDMSDLVLFSIAWPVALPLIVAMTVGDWTSDALERRRIRRAEEREREAARLASFVKPVLDSDTYRKAKSGYVADVEAARTKPFGTDHNADVARVLHDWTPRSDNTGPR